MTRPHLALLRGINVGGNNPVPMAELRDAFGDMGFTDVATYIQSGNVLFRGARVDENAIQARLSEQFSYHGRVVVLSGAAYRKNLAAAPPAWGHDDTRKHNALFTLAGMKPKEVLSRLPPLSEFEEVATGPGVIFWSAPKDKYTKTMFARKLVGHPMYKELTIRNQNTTFKLAKLLDEM
ncbi:MAG: DUF1697 domain-containing protein [Acidimicrobiia bacterium]|nr:DUF1697 domain-containing protein [Acidimicrobiia bacterium]NNL28130.1 DUF1697 domain-containing protein [Acidimicrobiia bacterium]